MITVILKELDRRYTNAEWIQRLKQRLIIPDDITLVFQSEYIGPPTDQPVTLHLMSNDDELRRGIAVEIADYLKSLPGLTEIDVDERSGTPQIDLNLNYEKLAMLQLDAADVSQTLAAAFHGIEASEHRGIQDTTELRVQFDPAARIDLQGLLATPVRASDGALVRHASRNGVDPNIRADLAERDAKFRKRKARLTQFRIVPVDRYDQAYKRQALNAEAEAARWRRAGARTPSSPPATRPRFQ